MTRKLLLRMVPDCRLMLPEYVVKIKAQRRMLRFSFNCCKRYGSVCFKFVYGVCLSREWFSNNFGNIVYGEVCCCGILWFNFQTSIRRLCWRLSVRLFHTFQPLSFFLSLPPSFYRPFPALVIHTPVVDFFSFFSTSMWLKITELPKEL